MLYITALIVHVISIVVWIGGVAFVTLVTFPMIRRENNSLEQVMMFQGVEHRFALIAKSMVILVGLSGLYLILEKGMDAGVWLMIFIWSFYAALLFGLEKIIFEKLFSKPGEKADMNKVFALLQGFHWIVLALSFLAIGAGLWTAHY
ncbi:MAG: hypothetical protein ISR96_06885 [Nitrospira sp.]|nr:hypothetical protein [bacterium]MBL7049219.1 hypothetical protein [Nitrospira sp.]